MHWKDGNHFCWKSTSKSILITDPSFISRRKARVGNEPSEPSREPLVGNEPSHERANPLAPASLGSWHLSSARSWLARAALRVSNKTLNKFKSINSIAYIHIPCGINDSFCMLQKFLRIKFAFDEYEYFIVYI